MTAIGSMSENKKVYFFSDVHLGFFDRKRDKKREDTLLAFLESIKHHCTTLVILGDLFDYWFEYHHVVPKYFYRTLAKLAEFRSNGIEVIYLMGNHDFGHRIFFSEELDIPVIRNDIERTFLGKRFYLSHGDGKAYNDRLYLILRSILRNKVAGWLFERIHPDWGISLASQSSKTSRQYTSVKNYGEREGMIDFAKDRISEGFDYVVMGHRHIADIIPFGNGFYVNLGDWLSEAKYGVFDGESFKIEHFELG